MGLYESVYGYLAWISSIISVAKICSIRKLVDSANLTRVY